MRIGLLSAWTSRLGGGVFEAVVAQARIIAGEGMTPVIFGLQDAHSGEDAGRFGDIEVHSLPVIGPASIGYAPGLAGALLAARLDILHLHGIWMYPSHAGAAWAARTGRRYVISPHGMLDPWITARGRGKKALARIGYERRNWRAASLFHALTDAERSDIVRETGRDAIAIVPNAVARPVPRDPAPAIPPTLLSLGRIHPKKNLDALLAGWAHTGARTQGWELVIAGWGEPDHVAAFEAALAGIGDRSIRFVGPLFGEAKAQAIAGARFLILPSLSEGLPMTMLEAWAAGRPTIMSAACHLPEGVAAGAAIETGTGSDAIAAAIDRAAGLSPAAYAEMCVAAARLAADRFAPDVVSARWRELYAGAPS